MEQIQNLIFVTGVDGSGKTTLLDTLSLQRPDLIMFRFPLRPQPQNRLRLKAWPTAVELTALGILLREADTQGDPHLKSLGLVLAMACYANLLREVLSLNPSAPMIVERHPVIDGLVYGPYYVQKMQEKSCLKPGYLNRKVQDLLGPSKAEALLESFRQWVDPASALSFTKDFEEIVAAIIAIFSQPLPIMGDNLKFAYRLPLGQVVLLTAKPEILYSRIISRSTPGVVHELHEKIESLAVLDQSYHNTLDELHQTKTVLKPFILNTEISEGSTIQKLMKVIDQYISISCEERLNPNAIRIQSPDLA